MPKLPLQLNRYALGIGSCLLVAAAATTACTSQTGTLNAQDTQQFAQAYAGLIDGTVGTEQYEAVVAGIATRLDASKAQEFTECAGTLAEAAGAGPYRDLKDSLAGEAGGEAPVPQGSESPPAGNVPGVESGNDALKDATDVLARLNADATRCGALLGVTLTP